MRMKVMTKAFRRNDERLQGNESKKCKIAAHRPLSQNCKIGVIVQFFFCIFQKTKRIQGELG